MDCELLTSDKIKEDHINELTAAERVTVSFDNLSRDEAFRLLKILRRENLGHTVPPVTSLTLGHGIWDKLTKVLTNK